jgi:hypothetical protein
MVIAICYVAAQPMKNFRKNKKTKDATSDLDPVLKRQRFLQARALLKRRRRKSHQ